MKSIKLLLFGIFLGGTPSLWAQPITLGLPLNSAPVGAQINASQEYIVKVKKEFLASPEDFQAALAELGKFTNLEIVDFVPERGWVLVRALRIPDAFNELPIRMVEKSMIYLKGISCVEEVEPNFVFNSWNGQVGGGAVNKDPMTRAAQRSAEAEAETSRVRVAVIDSGVTKNHKFLMASLGSRLNLDLAKDYTYNKEQPLLADDLVGGGTAIAAMLAGEASSGGEFIPSSFLAEVVPLRIHRGLENKPTLFRILRALEQSWKIDAKIVLIPVYFQSYHPWPMQFLEQSLNRLKKNGVLIVAASGDEGLSEQESQSVPSVFSQSFSNVLSVASVSDMTSKIEISSITNYGGNSISLAAVGSALLPQASDASGVELVPVQSSFVAATKVVAAVLQLMKEKNLTPLEAKKLILETVNKRAILSGKVKAGLLDLEAALLGKRKPTPAADPLGWEKRKALNLESEHPTGSRTSPSTQNYLIQIPDAKRMALNFRLIKIVTPARTTENDVIVIYARQKGEDKEILRITGYHENYITPVVFSDTVRIQVLLSPNVTGSPDLQYGFSLKEVIFQ